MVQYKVQLHNSQHGAVGTYLSCHSTVGTDSRGGDSAFVHVNCQHHGDTWSFEAVQGKLCTYRILLTHPGHLGNCGRYLGAHRTAGGDTRSRDSTYVNVNQNYYGDEWTLIPVPEKGQNAFRIRLSKSDHGAVGTWLTAHKTVSGHVLSDKRGGDSTYVNVNENNDGSYWKIQ